MRGPIIYQNPLYMEREIRLVHVANGWEVYLPVKQPTVEPEPTAGIFDQVIPLFKQMIKIRDEDSVLSEIRERNEQLAEDEPDDQAPAAPDPVIGQDPNLFVFATFGEVLQFLDDRFSVLDKA
jgi:hypothetical protein